MQNESLFGLAFETLQPLHVIGSSQCRCHQRLGFAAGEDRAAMRARQHSGFDPDVANFIECA